MTRLCFALLTTATLVYGQERFAASPALDQIIDQALRDRKFPGAVLLVGHQGKIVHRKAYGSRSTVPDREPMTIDTVFDAASLTKVVATTTSLMKLFEQGKFRLDDRVTDYLPEFQAGKSEITVRQLLTHFSGLRPDVDLVPTWRGYDTGINKALVDIPANPPGKKFVYSDINFLLLGEMVRRLSGEPLPDFAKHTIFEPLGMRDTTFQPPAAWIPRIAPTEYAPGTDKPLRGVVHDETCRNMGGIAGHAGLFTTANDLSKFAEMLLGLGERGGVRVVSAATVLKFTSPQTPLQQPVLRGLGWDIDSPLSTNRGELFPIGSYGHTGFTGTSMWIDPFSQTYVILLANSVHPKRGINIGSVRSKVATTVAAAFSNAEPPASSPYSHGHRPTARNSTVLNGIDVLDRAKYAPLSGQRIGLITNHTGLLRDGRRNIDAMKAGGVNLVALLSPEHGIAGKEDHENIGNSVDERSGLTVHSLYAGTTRRPSPAVMAKVDTLVFDIQDVGARFYTYVCTMSNALEEAARLHKKFVVLDRPNPITGTHVEGPILDADLESFVGCVSMPLRHGMTVGELAKMINAEKKWNANLEVIPVEGWQRGDWFDSTGLTWVNPSPNMRSLKAATLYPGLAMLEYSRNYSVGRGTDAPFEQIGADWIDGAALAAALNERRIPGVRVYATRFTPTASNFVGRSIGGVRFVITDRDQLDSVRLGYEVAAALQKLYPGKINFVANERLIGSHRVAAALQAGSDALKLVADDQDGIQQFLSRRQPFLLY